jgi:hypothetical protein
VLPINVVDEKSHHHNNPGMLNGETTPPTGWRLLVLARRLARFRWLM